MTLSAANRCSSDKELQLNVLGSVPGITRIDCNRSCELNSAHFHVCGFEHISISNRCQAQITQLNRKKDVGIFSRPWTGPKVGARNTARKPILGRTAQTSQRQHIVAPQATDHVGLSCLFFAPVAQLAELAIGRTYPECRNIVCRSESCLGHLTTYTLPGRQRAGTCSQPAQGRAGVRGGEGE